MRLTKCRLGEHVELLVETNADLTYGVEHVRGVNNLKMLMPTKADINGRDLTKFQIVSPGEFVFNHRTSRNGSKFSIAYNDGDAPVICTEDYVVFRIKEQSKTNLLDEWLYMFFNRSEFDRYVITNSWGSSTEFFNWEDVCDIEMELPPLSVQRKFVAIYKAMVANQRSYEQGLDDLKLVADAMIEKYKHTTKRMSLGELLQECDIRNSDNVVAEVDGVNKDKKFMPSIASGDDLSKYKLVEQGFFACNLMHIGRDVVVPIALNNADEFRLVSPAYMVLKTKGNNVLPEFVLMWMSRGETDRQAWFMSDSSVRSGMEKRRFFEITVPVPPIEEQKALVEIHKVLDQRKNINEQMKSQIKEICPVLIRGSLEYGG